MTDPYSVLGVDRNASDDEIKKAYRQLSRKYHRMPISIIRTKTRQKLSFKEVQQAYDQIVKGGNAAPLITGMAAMDRARDRVMADLVPATAGSEDLAVSVVLADISRADRMPTMRILSV